MQKFSLIFVAISVNNFGEIFAKIYDRCEFLNELITRHHLPRDEAAIWTCIAERQSEFNTQAQGQYHRYHGIFQISDEFWCYNENNEGKGACGMSCDRFRDDDVTDDLYCVKRIYYEHYYLSGGDGYSAWPSGKYCQTYSSWYQYICENSIKTPETSNYVNRRRLIPQISHQVTALESQANKIYDRCELARELYYDHNIPFEQISTFVCIAKFESHYNTSAIGKKPIISSLFLSISCSLMKISSIPGNGDFGIFQISNLYWCDEHRRGKGCQMSCTDFLDSDLTDDVHCMKKIYNSHAKFSENGFTAWSVYNKYCRGDVSRYIKGCFKL